VAVASALHALIVAREMSLRDPGHDPVRMPRYWWTEATVVGQSLGGGVAMQFTYQHRDYCQRLALISSGGLGPDLR